MAKRRKKARRIGIDAPAPSTNTGHGRTIVQQGFLPLAIALAIGSLLLYWGTLHYEFVWDGEGYNLTANAELMRGNYRFFWEQPYVDFYIPVSYTAWIGLKSIGDAIGEPGVLRPEVFRAANVAVHAANAVLVMYLAFAFCRSTVTAFAAAALFAAHPLQIESVVWVSEFRGLLAALFSLVGLIVHLRNCARPAARPALVTVGLLTVLAMLAKPSAVVMPLILLVADWMVAGEVRFTRKRVFYVAVWCALTVPVIIVTRLVQPATEIEAAVPMLLRPFVAFDAFNHYMLKTMLPVSLSVSYGRTPPLVLGSSLTYALWILPVAAALAGVWAYRRHPKPVLALAFAPVALLPVSGLLPFKGQNYSTVADRYAYFPIVGVALAVAWALSRMKGRWAVATAAACLVLMVPLNLRQQPTWKDELALFGTAAERYPGQPRIHNSLGVALQRDGRHEEAIGQFDASLRSDSKYADAYCNRGVSRAQMGQLREALADQSSAVSLDPADGGCRYNRAVTYLRLGDPQLALSDAQQAERSGFTLPQGFVDAILRRLNGRR